MKSNVPLIVLFIVCLSKLGNSLECYVCSNQDGNKGKCLVTIATCQQEDDMCLTEIKWGTTPYWQAGAEKQYYISKRCSTKQQCDKSMKKLMPVCTHVWYEDWKCSECCAGDRCNYYIMSGSRRMRHSVIVTAALVALSSGWLLAIHR